MHPTLAALKLQMQLSATRPAADIEALPRVGGMSSIPTRAADLGRVLAAILPQVDRLHLFLHGYPDIPEPARQPGVIPCLAPVNDPYRASGKFYGLSRESAPCCYFGFDDDILYKAGHVDRLVRGLRRYRGRAVVGLHGRRALSPDATFSTGRRSYHFERRLWLDHVVDDLGAGTIALVSSALTLDPPGWPYGDMDDQMLAIDAERQGVPRVAIARPERSIEAIATNQPDSLFAAARRDDTRQTEQVRRLLELMGKRPTG